MFESTGGRLRASSSRIKICGSEQPLAVLDIHLSVRLNFPVFGSSHEMSDGNSQIVRRRVWQKHEFKIVTICLRHKTTSIPHVIHLKLHHPPRSVFDSLSFHVLLQLLHPQNRGRGFLNMFSWNGDFLKIFSESSSLLFCIVFIHNIRQKPAEAFGALTDDWNWHFSVIWLRTAPQPP